MNRRHGEGSSRREGESHRHRRDRSRHRDPRGNPRAGDRDNYTESERRGHRTNRGEDEEEDDHRGSRHGDRGREQRNSRGERAADNRNNHHEERPGGEGNNDGGAEEPPPPSYDESMQNQQLVVIGNQSGGGDDTSEEQGGVIGLNLEAVRRFTSGVMATKCHTCGLELMVDFSLVEWVEDWWHGARRRSGKRSSEKCLICVADCPSCGKKTCVGCGQAPRRPKSRKLEKVHLLWCCPRGRMFAIWVMLASLDQKELQNQSDTRPSEQGRSTVPRRPTSSRHPGRTGDERGVGYADSGRNDAVFDMFQGPTSARPNLPRPIRFRGADPGIDITMAAIFDLLVELIPSTRNGRPPPELTGMLQLSLVFDKAAEMLRNDSLDDVLRRKQVYRELFWFVNRLCTNPNLFYLVTSTRRSKRKTAGLQAISQERNDGQSTSLMELDDETSASLVDQLKNLAKQSRLVLRSANRREFQDRKGKDMLRFCEGVAGLYKNIKLSGPRTRRRAMTKEEKWEVFHEKFALTRDERILGPSYGFMGRAQRMVHSNPGRMKRLVTEAANMATSLQPGIFVKVGESRPDIMKCLIMGPPDSPYGYGLFEFDILCTEQYPLVPPFVVCRTVIGAPVISPNLHINGKVCLSLLGTWREGDAAAQWQPGKSTILSVLISIQAMVFSEEPWRNEPAFTSRVGHQAEQASRRFNENVQPMTIWYAMLPWLRNRELRNGIWKEVVKRHFYLNARKIADNLSRWAERNRSITRLRGDVIGVPSRRPIDIGKVMLKVLYEHRAAVERGRRSR